MDFVQKPVKVFKSVFNYTWGSKANWGFEIGFFRITNDFDQLRDENMDFVQKPVKLFKSVFNYTG